LDELAELDALSEVSELLRLKRYDLKRKINQFHSPIMRQLPPDVMSTVFEFCLPLLLIYFFQLTIFNLTAAKSIHVEVDSIRPALLNPLQQVLDQAGYKTPTDIQLYNMHWKVEISSESLPQAPEKWPHLLYQFSKNYERNLRIHVHFRFNSRVASQISQQFERSVRLWA
jgi:hypothetical protein